MINHTKKVELLRQLHRVQQSVRQRVKRDLVQSQLIATKGGRCERCSKRYHGNIYDFHHIEPKSKGFNLDRSNFGRSFEALVEEVKKCALLCANCHREVHTYNDKLFLKLEPIEGFRNYV